MNLTGANRDAKLILVLTARARSQRVAANFPLCESRFFWHNSVNVNAKFEQLGILA